MRISFMASLPPIQSALSVSGDRAGGRLKLDIPETELPQALKVLLMSGRVFRVTVETEDEGQ